MEGGGIAFNISEELFFSINKGIQYGLFFIIYLPTLITIVVSAVTVVCVRKFPWKFRVLLLNIFAGEACTWIGATVSALGYPARYHSPEDSITCRVSTSLYFLAKIETFAGIALYGIMVYLYYKYDEKKLKWKVIVSCIVAAWTSGLILISIIYIPSFEVGSRLGFCSGNTRSALYRVCLGLLLAEMLSCFGIVVFFSVLTCRLIKKHQPQGETNEITLKRSLAKSFIYFTILCALAFIFSIVPAILPAVSRSFESKSLSNFIVRRHVIRLIFLVPLILNPVTTILILKPLRSGIATGTKLFLAKLCHYCCKKNEATDPVVQVTNPTFLRGDSVMSVED